MPVTDITIDEFTTKNVDGNGVFDTLMTSASNHLNKEYEAGRIEGKEYSNVYIQMMQVSMQTALAFTLGKQKSTYEALLLEQQISNLEQDKLNSEKQNDILAKQNLKLDEEIDLLQSQDLDVQKSTALKNEQIETERAKTRDVLSDTSPVGGLVKADKDIKAAQADVYTNQAQSFTNNDKIKVAKFYADNHNLQKSLDSGLTSPSEFTNANVDSVVGSLRTDIVGA